MDRRGRIRLSIQGAQLLKKPADGTPCDAKDSSTAVIRFLSAVTSLSVASLFRKLAPVGRQKRRRRLGRKVRHHHAAVTARDPFSDSHHAILKPPRPA